MASREVVITSCDQCGTEWQMPLKKAGKAGDTYKLPSGWLHLEAKTSHAVVLSVDLCAECKKPALAAAGKGLLQ